MSISRNSRINWDDVNSIYNDLNRARTQWGFPTVTPSGAQNQNVQYTDAVELKNKIEEMSSNAYISQIAKVTTEMPKRGDVIEPYQISSMSNTIDDIINTCAFDAAFRSFRSFRSSFDSGFRGSFRGSHDSSFRSFRSGHGNSGNFSFGFTCSRNNSFNFGASGRGVYS